MDVNEPNSGLDQGRRHPWDDPTPAATTLRHRRARRSLRRHGTRLASRKSSRLRVVLASATHGLSIALLAGCGGPFEVGDEAWVELPGTSWPYDEYAVVEVVSLADDRARVELIERLPVVEGQRMRSDVKRSSANRLLRRLEAGRSTYVAEDELLAPEDGEEDIEAKRNILQLVRDFARAPIEFCYHGEAADVEAVLGWAEQRGLEEAAGPLELLLDFVERHSAITREELDLELAYSSVRESADALRERLTGGREAYRELLDALDKGLQVEPEPAVAVGSMASLSLGSAISMMTAACVYFAEEPSSPYSSSAFKTELNLAESSDAALEATAARIEAAESFAKLMTRDGEQTWDDWSMREWVASENRLIAADVAALALEAAGEAGEIANADDAEAVLAQARELTEPFDGDLDFEPMWGAGAIEMYGALVRSLETEVAVAITDRELERAAEGVEDYLELSRELGALYARHDKSKLIGANANEHADDAGKRLFERIRLPLSLAAKEVLGSASNVFDSQALADREPRVREFVAPIEAALGRGVLDDSFFHDARQKAEANTQRKLQASRDGAGVTAGSGEAGKGSAPPEQ